MSLSICQRRTPSPGPQLRKQTSQSPCIPFANMLLSSGDAKKANLLLTNNVVNPPVKITLKEDIDTSSGSYKLPAQTDIKLNSNYKFQLVDSNTTGILSESPQFTVLKVASEKPTASPTASGASGTTPTESPASTSSKASGADKVGAWGFGGLLVAAGFAALL